MESIDACRKACASAFEKLPDGALEALMSVARQNLLITNIATTNEQRLAVGASLVLINETLPNLTLNESYGLLIVAEAMFRLAEEDKYAEKDPERNA